MCRFFFLRSGFLLLVFFANMLSPNLVCAETLREKWNAKHPPDAAASEQESDDTSDSNITGRKVLRDIAYGSDPKQKLDVYLPSSNLSTPAILVMVHGGAWRFGDKRAASVVDNKAKHWLTKGFIFVSTNYRMLPDTPPLQQAQDVANSLAFVQQHAAEWGGNPSNIILMGHSAGAHLVALITASPDILQRAQVKPWLGTIALDSAAYDITAIMARKHYRFYDQAFGDQEQIWRLNSPLLALHRASVPFLAVCSSTRQDHPCDQASQFVDKANGMQMRATLLPQALSHGDINKLLGSDQPYTKEVDAFIASILPP